MTDRYARWLAWLWLAVVLLTAAHQVAFWRAAHFDTDVLALLPHDARTPEREQATQALADAAARRVVVALGSTDAAGAREAAAAWRVALKPLLDWREQPAGANADTLVAAYAPYRDRLLTPSQRAHLAQLTPQAAQAEALRALHQPGPGLRLTPWAADPLGLWPAWWAARAGDTLARPDQGELVREDGGRHWVVLLYDVGKPALALDGNPVIADALAQAEAAARRAAPDLEVLRAGVPLHAEAAAVQASREINTIGWGSLAAVLLLAWAAFRRGRPLLLIGLSLLIGTAVGLSVTLLVFDRVHLLTLVFGASLVGVAEDYGIHYYATRQSRPSESPRQLLTHVRGGLLLALLTSVLGYGVLAWAPFPGLRQMAVFSAVGLAAAFATVYCWFAWLDGPAPPRTRFASAVAGSLAKWPRLTGRWPLGLATALAAAALLPGLMHLRSNDDVRQLQAAPPELVAQQQALSRLLGVASPTQFFLVTAPDAQTLLEREEALTARLDGLAVAGLVSGHQAVSDWLPSVARQRSDAALTAQAEAGAITHVNAQLGEALARPAFAQPPLTPEAWLASPAAAAARPLWLGPLNATELASVVLLRGLHDRAALPRVAAAADGLAGVQWVDKPQEISELLGRYRVSLLALLLVGHALVLATLTWRYGRAAWRAWAPTALASLAALALLGTLGYPLQLFNVLALLLLLGVGVDYGIFLLEHPDDGAAWLAVLLGATSTALAFALLGLSTTPALHAFGLTLGAGLVVVTLAAPLLRTSCPRPLSI